jgi:hypothetical protein
MLVSMLHSPWQTGSWFESQQSYTNANFEPKNWLKMFPKFFCVMDSKEVKGLAAKEPRLQTKTPLYI